MKLFLFVFLSFLILSCSGTQVADQNQFQLSEEKAYSKISGLYVNLPYGWFTAEDNGGNNVDLWIIKNDYSASITFEKINLDDHTYNEIAGSDLSKIEFYSRAFAKAKLGGNFDEFNSEGISEINGKTFSVYYYQNKKNQFIRTAVFKLYNSYFECCAVTGDKNEITGLIEIQNAVLSSVN